MFVEDANEAVKIRYFQGNTTCDVDEARSQEQRRALAAGAAIKLSNEGLHLFSLRHTPAGEIVRPCAGFECVQQRLVDKEKEEWPSVGFSSH